MDLNFIALVDRQKSARFQNLTYLTLISQISVN